MGKKTVQIFLTIFFRNENVLKYLNIRSLFDWLSSNVQLSSDFLYGFTVCASTNFCIRLITKSNWGLQIERK